MTHMAARQPCDPSDQLRFFANICTTIASVVEALPCSQPGSFAGERQSVTTPVTQRKEANSACGGQTRLGVRTTLPAADAALAGAVCGEHRVARQHGR